MFKVPAFSASLLANSLTIFVGLGSFLFLAQYLQLVLGLSPLVAGFWTLPSAAGNVIGFLAVSMLVRKIRPIIVVSGGLVLNIIGLAFYALIEADSGLTYVVIGSVIISLEICSVVISGTDLIVGSTAPERAGAAASISETGVKFGGVLGIAVLGSIGTAVYKNRMNSLIFNGISPKSMESAKASLGAAVAIAKELPEDIALSLLYSFTDSFQLVSIICAVISFVLAVTIFMMRKSLEKDEGL